MNNLVTLIPDVIIAGLLVYILNRLSNLSDRVSKIEGLIEGYFLRKDPPPNVK